MMDQVDGSVQGVPSIPVIIGTVVSKRCSLFLRCRSFTVLDFSTRESPRVRLERPSRAVTSGRHNWVGE